MASRSLGSITIDLLLKQAGFKEGLDKAGRALDDQQRKLQKLEREATKTAERLRTPLEVYQAELQKIAALKIAAPQIITSDVETRAIEEAKRAYDALNPEVQEHNRLMAEGARATAALMTPQERLDAEIARADKLLNTYDATLKRTAIDQQTYNRMVAKAHADFKTATTGASNFGGALSRVRGLLIGIGVPLTFGAIVSQLKNATLEAIKFGDEIAKAMDKTGLGAEAMTELAGAAKQSEIDLDTLTVALRNMNVLVSDAVDPTSAAAKTLKELGLSAAELLALPTDKRLEVFADAIAEFGKEADRSAFRLDVFKRAGDAIAPMLERGGAGVREATARIRELGGSFGPQEIGVFKTADQAVDDLSTSFDALKLAIAGITAAPLAETLDGITLSIVNLNKVIQGQMTLSDAWRLATEARANAQKVAQDEYLEGIRKAIEAEGILGKAVALTKAIYDGHAVTLTDVAREYAKLASSANELSEITITTPRIGTRTRAPDADKKGPSEAENARKAIQDLLTTMQQQIAVTGETEEATMRYRIAFGDLVDDFKKAGPAFASRKQDLIDAAAAMDRFKANEELDQANKQLREQVVELQAARIAQEQGVEAAIAYRAANGELGRTLDLATDSLDEYTRKLRERQAAEAEFQREQAVSTIDASIKALEAETSSIIANQIAMEEGAVAALRYRIAHGDLKDVFENAGDAAADMQRRFEEATAKQEELNERQRALAASEEIIPSRTKALKEYEDAIEGLNIRLAELDITQKEYDQGVKRAKKNYEEATRALDDMSKFAEEAARNMQDALADFLFDPFKEGLDGMLEGLATTLRRMAAEIIAAQLAEKFHFEDILRGGIGGIFGGGGGGTFGGGPVPGVPGAISLVGGAKPDLVPPHPLDFLTGATGGAGAAGATSMAAAMTTAGTTAAAAITAAGTTMAAAITTAGSAAAAAIAAAGATGGAAAGGTELLTDLFRTAGLGAAEGGKIAGPSGVDVIPARLTAGEFVVKAESVKKPGVEALLNRINDGIVFRGYALGGRVERYAGGGIVAPPNETARSERTLIQHLHVTAQGGQVSRATEMQITAAAARGARIADRHNN